MPTTKRMAGCPTAPENAGRRKEAHRTKSKRTMSRNPAMETMEIPILFFTIGVNRDLGATHNDPET
jgi:hypothetical protein